jgi:hypothetical protein
VGATAGIEKFGVESVGDAGDAKAFGVDGDARGLTGACAYAGGRVGVITGCGCTGGTA